MEWSAHDGLGDSDCLSGYLICRTLVRIGFRNTQSIIYIGLVRYLSIRIAVVVRYTIGRRLSSGINAERERAGRNGGALTFTCTCQMPSSHITAHAGPHNTSTYYVGVMDIKKSSHSRGMRAFPPPVCVEPPLAGCSSSVHVNAFHMPQQAPSPFQQ